MEKIINQIQWEINYWTTLEATAGNPFDQQKYRSISAKLSTSKRALIEAHNLIFDKQVI